MLPQSVGVAWNMSLVILVNFLRQHLGHLCTRRLVSACGELQMLGRTLGAPSLCAGLVSRYEGELKCNLALFLACPPRKFLVAGAFSARPR
eukprot:6662770-Pyramimonas_sp.AAC.1